MTHFTPKKPLMYEILFPTLSFPLNVYAQALWKTEAELQYLHYGLWQTGFNLAQAQQAATAVLMAALPASPASVLEVGIGLGTTARRLQESGYPYTGITPDNAQILYARHRLSDLPQMPCFVHTTFEQFLPSEKFQVIVFQESAQYIKVDNLLRGCHAALDSGGQVLIMDEFSAPVCAALEAGLPNASFQILRYEDFTQQAAPSISYLIQAIEQQRAAVLYDLNLSATRLEALMHSLKQRERAYQNQSYFYKLLLLQKN